MVRVVLAVVIMMLLFLPYLIFEFGRMAASWVIVRAFVSTGDDDE